MKKTLGLVVAAGIFASTAMAANLNVSVEQLDGSNTITVGPGATVEYSVMGQLDNDADNRGLALVGFDLELLIEGTSTQADPLPPADEPTEVDMLNFAVPEGINNPAGFGGTESSGKLLQVGGAQNTINNTLDCMVNDDCPGASNLCEEGTCTASAPFPLGTVIENLGHTQFELAKGSLTAPAAEGTYVLTLTDLFANVISTTQNSPDFLATEAAGVGSIDNLSITVVVEAVAFDTWESVATHGGVGEVGLEILENGTYVEPRLAGISKVRVSFTGAIDPVTAGPGSVDVIGCDPAGASIDLSSMTITTNAINADTQLEIMFSPKLPGSLPTDDPAKYRITLTGIMSPDGRSVGGNGQRDLKAVLGDVVGAAGGGDGRVSAPDVAATRSFAAASINPIDPANMFHVRSDIITDGRITAPDVAAARAMAALGKDGRSIPCP